MKKMQLRRAKKCTPGGVYLLYVMGRSIKDIAVDYGRSVDDINLMLAIAMMRPEKGHKKAAPLRTGDRGGDAALEDTEITADVFMHLR